ncbi:MAG TPA: hypothetical protein VGC43_04320 [Luteimonas sp.]
MTLNLRTIAATAALVLGTSGLAQAQSTSGNIQGVAAAGDTIVVQGVGSGFNRELAIPEDGKYSMRRLPTGKYLVIQKHADGSAEAPKPVEIHAGVTVRVN